MERRQHPRVQLPLLVEIQHPTLGKRNCIARDVSEGGVFVQLDTEGIQVGAKLKLTLQNPSTIDAQPTPTVQMEVVRVEPEGLGLSFINNTNRYLWESVERLRDELAVGRDYFQLHISALVIGTRGELLVVQQSGKWTFPGTYLIVGDSWRDALERLLGERFGIEVSGSDMSLLTMETETNERLPEAAVAKAFAAVHADTSAFHFEPGDRYTAARWVRRSRMLDEMTFADDLSRSQALAAFDWFSRQGR